MNVLKFLLIGDIHYPEVESVSIMDDKDPSFPPNMKTKVTANPLTSVLRQMQRICEDGVDGILILGDLTSKGSVRHYINITNKLISLLQLDSAWNTDSIHITPGNHDLIRRWAVDEDDDRKKFKPFKIIWKRNNLDCLVWDNPRITELSVNNNQAVLCSLNSCIGCGAKRYLPIDIRSEFEDAISRYTERVGFDKANEMLFEDLDTPAFREKDVDIVCEQINRADDKKAIIVMAHHNILPQVKIRFSMYTEVINGGLVRSRFSNCNKPVIYCHGHIHERSVEMVKAYGSEDSSLLVSISAPLLNEGFNMLSIFYTENKIPIGCTISPYVFDKNGSVPLMNKQEISFVSPENVMQIGSKKMSDLVGLLKSNFMRFPNLHDKYIKKYGSCSSDEFVEILIEAKWFGLIEINNDNHPEHTWHIRRMV